MDQIVKHNSIEGSKLAKCDVSQCSHGKHYCDVLSHIRSIYILRIGSEVTLLFDPDAFLAFFAPGVINFREGLFVRLTSLGLEMVVPV